MSNDDNLNLLPVQVDPEASKAANPIVMSSSPGGYFNLLKGVDQAFQGAVQVVQGAGQGAVQGVDQAFQGAVKVAGQGAGQVFQAVQEAGKTGQEVVESSVQAIQRAEAVVKEFNAALKEVQDNAGKAKKEPTLEEKLRNIKKQIDSLETQIVNKNKQNNSIKEFTTT